MKISHTIQHLRNNGIVNNTHSNEHIFLFLLTASLCDGLQVSDVSAVTEYIVNRAKGAVDVFSAAIAALREQYAYEWDKFTELNSVLTELSETFAFDGKYNYFTVLNAQSKFDTNPAVNIEYAMDVIWDMFSNTNEN